MPWKETCSVHERLKFIAAHDEGDQTISGLCRAFGVSRKTAYKWIERYRAEGVSGLEDRPRARRTQAHATAAEVEALIVEARKAHPTWGPRKIVAWLATRHPEIDFPAPSTCGDVLKRLGLTAGKPDRARLRAGEPSPESAVGYRAPNTVWCADFKGQFRTRDGALCYPLTITDGHSRYILRCEALSGTGEPLARPGFEAAFREFGLPQAIRTDNGPPFATRSLHGLSKLSAWWLKLGIWLERIEPGHPEQNGRHERMHRTLKSETAYPPRGSLAEQQAAFDDFRREFNEERPHEALAQKPPKTAYERSPRPYPEDLGDCVYPGHFEVARVNPNGAIRWGRQTLHVSQALAGELIGLEPIDEDLYSLHFAGHELATIDDGEGAARILPHAVGPSAWPLAWWLAKAHDAGMGESESTIPTGLSAPRASSKTNEETEDTVS
jgi:transposase InsO family protein